MRKKGLPEVGELVVCKIRDINPNSAFAEMIEYRKTGMIHVSEVAKRWVRNIREFLKENQHVVCKVMSVEGGNVLLSVKRVDPKEAKRKLNKFKKEKKAEKMLEMVAKILGKNLDQAYKEVGFILQEVFGSLDKAFEMALKNPKLLEDKNIPKKWIEPMIEISKKSYTEKIYELKIHLKLICYKPNGIEVIKNVLSSVKGFEIKYISSPNYLMIGKGKNFKELETKMVEIAKKIVKDIRKNDGEADFKIIQHK